MMIKKISPKNRDTYIELMQLIETLKKNGLNSYLGNKGYSIYKVCLTNDIITYIKTLPIYFPKQKSLLKFSRLFYIISFENYKSNLIPCAKGNSSE